MTRDPTTPDNLELSIVMPCLNEEKTVGPCVDQAIHFLNENNLAGEVIVADNGSIDGSAEIAEAHGARVVLIHDKGYGSALRGGFAAARGDYIIMGDADGNHDLSNLLPFLKKLRSGYDLVVGNRFSGGIESGAMTWIRQYVGNPALSFIGRLFFHTPVRDFHCGLRGIRKDSLTRMYLQTTGMELASEMIVKASILNMRVCEIPVQQFADDPERVSHLRSFHDGWRHLRFLLLYSPRWLFYYPGLMMLILGLGLSARLFLGPITIGEGVVDFHTLIYAGTFTIIGLNLLSFAIITRLYAYNHLLLPNRPSFFILLKYFKLERGVLLGGGLVLFGIILTIITFYLGFARLFSEVGWASTIRLVYGSSMLLILGSQVFFTSFVLSILGLKVRASNSDENEP
jgi:glycosyltransferase involved in cell wall biosynthesis